MRNRADATTRQSPAPPVEIAGIPETADPAQAALLRSRISTAVAAFVRNTNTPLDGVGITIGPAPARQTPERREGNSAAVDDPPLEVRARKYVSRQPLFEWSQMVVPQAVEGQLGLALARLEVQHLVFDTWGLRQIEPFPACALNLYGRPGTGKTLAAHAIAHRTGRCILEVNYAAIESKYHGDGPKNVEAVFFAAEREGALLFVDEADSLLSKRLTEVTQGSEQAINSMRSQLLICLERFKGIVVFATNLVENYDKAFETRLQSIHFPFPDEECRRRIWESHLVPSLPIAPSVSPVKLAQDSDDLCGRDIKNAVINAAVSTAIEGACVITEEALARAVSAVREARIRTCAESPGQSPREKGALATRIRESVGSTSGEAGRVEPEA